jgi:hypothetical protein
MLNINHAVLQVFDFTSNLCLLSRRELDVSDGLVNTYLEKLLERLLASSDNKTGTFLDQSLFKGELHKYLDHLEDFLSLASYIGTDLFHHLSLTDKLDPADLLVVDFTSEDVAYVGFLMLGHKTAYTHQVVNEAEGGVSNRLIPHYAILPGPTQRVDSYALVNQETLEIAFGDITRHIDGEEAAVVADKLLQCSATVSAKEVLKTVNKIAKSVAEEHAANPALVMSKAKSYVLDNAEVSDQFSPRALGAQVFADAPAMKSDFEARVAEAHLPPTVQVDKKAAVAAAKSQKLKTDTGIELTVPSDCLHNPEYIEFINNPDGSLSIELKHISKLVNRS